METVQTENPARIGLILPYFGKFPNYFPLFLESCRWNPSIDWLLYTDSDVPYAYPENIKVHKTSFEDFRARLQEAYDFPISLDTPYKLCDFKPTYGDTLQSDLKDYDFWGHCDCDLIFGNIRKFITPEVTAQYDRILNCGHLILYRNIPEVNTYYRTQTYLDYKPVLSSPKNHSFDEWPGISECWRRDGKPCFGKLCFDDAIIRMEDFRPVQRIPGGYVGPYHDQPSEVSRFRKMQNILYAFREGKVERCWVQDGQVQREELLYIHLQKRKMQVAEGLLNNSPEDFLIVPNSFIPPVPLTVEILKQLAPKSLSKATRKSSFVFMAMVVKYELTSIGKPDYRSRSAVWNHFSHKKNQK